ncbi:adenylate/guanylate cyclase domain-containing protein [Ancylobacter pratisalsi]|uniref:Adenylate/guanylate cyclase domain-containing protein n=1 Tax=Ancylobacter pratisalsi TaxID=1745854 RepID=A0A6P1YSU3_9HYPH|nr:adenylate/guanylate cyclase domain-containing protein [Ancylobacter pratisalsi]QIB35960.1 adenylate/guanylate cyclase domain-containing protein [Ancylobacter pratisalsi]
MTSTTQDDQKHASLRTGRDYPWGCLARQWSGFLLFAFVLTHLLNHAVGIFGIEAMQYVQQWRWLIWQSWPGSVLFYAAVVVHMFLSGYRIALRRTWRMPPDEMWQIVSGLTIPLLAVGHVLQTRVAGSMFGADISYGSVLFLMWPAVVFSQTMLIVVAWSHGVIGLHHALRYQPWYRHWRIPGYILAVLIPCLAFAGFVSAGREASKLTFEPRTQEQAAGVEEVGMVVRSGVAGFAVAFVGLMGLLYLRRRVGSTITITYRGYGPVEVPAGTSVLEASRTHHIPHPSSCRGRGRCATCRVQILAGEGNVAEPFGAESAILNSIAAPPSVRLACQVRPSSDISVRVLMPVLGRHVTSDQDAEALEWAMERDAAVLVLDLRAFATLTQNRLPYEIAVLVNRFSNEMCQAVESHDGRIDVMYGDGLTAVFDQSEHRAVNARSALRAAQDMGRVLEMLNAEMRGVLPIPIRAGIGIHTGRVVLARIGDGIHQQEIRAIGDTLSVAAALESASKDFIADCMVSKETADASGFNFSGMVLREVMLDGGHTSIQAYAIPDAGRLEQVTSSSPVLGTLKLAGA